MKWTIRRQIVVSFGVILTLTLIVAAVAYKRLSRIDQEAAAVKGQSLPSLEFAASIQDAWSDDFLLTEEYVLQSDQAVKQRVLARVTVSRTQLEKLMTNYEGTIARASERQAFDEFKTARTAYARFRRGASREREERIGTLNAPRPARARVRYRHFGDPGGRRVEPNERRCPDAADRPTRTAENRRLVAGGVQPGLCP